jgi:hypothetical protein
MWVSWCGRHQFLTVHGQNRNWQNWILMEIAVGEKLLYFTFPKHSFLTIIYYLYAREQGKRSRYSDWLRAGRQRGRSSSPGRDTFLFSTSSRSALLPQPPFQWVPRALSPGVKRSGSEAERWPPTSAEVKNKWIYTSTPPYAFMA